MAEVFSQEEIDQILAAVNAGTEPEDFHPVANTREIKIYDFKRPDKFSRGQIRSISELHEGLVRTWAEYLYRSILAPVLVHIASVDQLTYEEFIRSIPSQTTLMAVPASLDGNALPSRIIVEIDPAIMTELLYKWFDGLYTRKYFLNNSENRMFYHLHELTSLEKAVLRYYGPILLGKYSALLTDYCGVSLQTRDFNIETNPQYLNIISPYEMVALTTFETKINDVEGMINIALPYLLLEPVLPYLSRSYFYSVRNPQITQIKKSTSRTHIPGIQVDLRAELFRKTVRYEELSGMDLGFVIRALDNYNKTSCLIMNGSTVLFKGEDSTNYQNPQSTKRLKITEKITPYKEFNIMNDKPNLIVEKALAKMNVQVIVELGRTCRTQEELLQAREGTIMELNKWAGGPVDIFANNVLFAKGEVVVIDESFGVRLTEILVDNGSETTEDKNDSDV
jgi:flagellar motor switch protein FliM